MRQLELRIPPVGVTILFGAMMWGSAQLFPACVLAFPGRIAAAVAMMAASLLVGVAGIRAFNRHETTVNPMVPEKANALVTSGIYRITRNPMYLALALLLLAWAIFLRNSVALGLVLLFVLYLTQFQIKPEERALEELFGDEFRAYAARVRRWL